MPAPIFHSPVLKGGTVRAASTTAPARRLAPLAFLFWIFSVTANAAPSAELAWRNFETLEEGERYYAQTALYDMWGDDPKLWPDWLEPAALRVAAGPGASWLIVRQPLHQPCGEYGFTVLGPVDADKARHPLGSRFCGGTLGVVPPAWGRTQPDILISETREKDAEGNWTAVAPQRWRWVGNGWGLVK